MPLVQRNRKWLNYYTVFNHNKRYDENLKHKLQKNAPLIKKAFHIIYKNVLCSGYNKVQIYIKRIPKFAGSVYFFSAKIRQAYLIEYLINSKLYHFP